MDGQLDNGEQSWTIVLQPQFAVVQMRDRFGEGEAEPRTFLGTAGIQSAEPPPCLVAPLRSDAGPAITDLDPDLPLTRLDPHADFAARGTVANGVLQEVAYRLREQLTVAE